MTDGRPLTLWRWFFVAAALEAGAAVLSLALVPSEGLSLPRLVLLAFLGLSCLLAAFFAFRPPPALESASQPAWIWLAGLASFLWALALFFLRYLDPGLLPFYERLRPLLLFLLLISVQSCLLMLALHNGLHLAELRRWPVPFQLWLPIFASLLLLLLVIAVTRLGLTPDPAYWGEPGVAIQAWQFGLALLGGLLAFVLSGPEGQPPKAARFLPVLIYSLALGLWLSVPDEVLKNGFYVSLDPPSYQPFPYSDAGYYDTMAQSLSIGHPYFGEIPTRPLYILFLAGLHLVFGQRYDLVLVGQTLVLAIIPVLLYWLGAKIHSRAAGLTAALFFIFRELTSLLITSETRVSNTRTLLVDLPTMLLVLVGCLFALRWLERRDFKSALLAGGSLGLLLLLRTQSLLLLPAVLLLAAMNFGLRSKSFYLQSVVLLLGLLLAIAPWLLHNYLQSGHLSLDAAFQYKLLGTQYAYTGNLDIGAFDYEGKSLGQILMQFILKDPGFVFGFILNHFLAGWVGGMLALPLFETYNGIFAPLNLYWMSWGGHLPWYNLGLIIAYLAVIALGLACSWRRWRWAGLLPLAFNIGYSLATAIGRFSGWRYDLPADWVPYFYFATGFAELLAILGSLLGKKQFSAQSYESSPADREFWPRRLFVPALVFILIGALPWIAASFVSPRYSDASQSTLMQSLAGIPGSPQAAQLDGFLADPDAVLVRGRLVYPRFFSRGTGLASSKSWPAYQTRDFAREGFLLLNQARIDALFPTREPYDFPPGSDALLLGCRREDYIESRLVAFPALQKVYLAEGGLGSCSDDN